MTIVIEQFKSLDSSGTSMPITFDNNVKAGSYIFAAMRWGTPGTLTCADGTNTYTKDKEQADSAGTSQEAVLWQAFNAVLAARTVTLGNSVSTTFRGTIFEVSGLATSSVLDVTASAPDTGGSTAASSGSVSTTNANDLLIGVVTAGGNPTHTLGNMGSGAAATLIDNVGSGKLVTFYKVVSATGSYQANDTLGTSDTWAAILAAYKLIAVITATDGHLEGGLQDLQGL